MLDIINGQAIRFHLVGSMNGHDIPAGSHQLLHASEYAIEHASPSSAARTPVTATQSSC